MKLKIANIVSTLSFSPELRRDPDNEFKHNNEEESYIA